MAGTINLSLSQQCDSYGNPLSGGKLYFYAANTTTPQNVYQDTALSIVHPNPLTLDSAGRVPEFYCANGYIRARLTDRYGVIQIDLLNTLVIGPSSGGGGGSSVDSSTIFQTGDILGLLVPSSVSRSGWVRVNARTIGNAVSGATERANADTAALFSFLYSNFADGYCPVSGGRGASAAADYAANKTITLPDLRGRSLFGLDDMGNASAARLATGVPFTLGSNIVAGSCGGAATSTISQANLPAVTLTTTVNAAATGISGTIPGTFATAAAGSGGSPSLQNSATVAVTVTDPTHTHTATTPLGGSGTVLNNTPNFVLGTFYMKL